MVTPYSSFNFAMIALTSFMPSGSSPLNSVEPTEELLEAIRILNDAQDKDYAQKCHIEQMVKLSEYELQKIYFEVIKELTKEEHLLDMVIPMYVEKDLINKD